MKHLSSFLFLPLVLASITASAADYRALYDCLGGYTGGYPAAEANPSAAATWANELQGSVADEIPSASVWEAIMAHRSADWRPVSGTTSGGKAIDDADRDDVRYSVLGGGRTTLPVAPGAWGRTLLIDVFGGSSDVITQLQTQFTEYARRCAGFGGEVEPGDITEAIRLHGV